jgi:hypothetical protein
MVRNPVDKKKRKAGFAGRHFNGWRSHTSHEARGLPHGLYVDDLEPTQLQHSLLNRGNQHASPSAHRRQLEMVSQTVDATTPQKVKTFMDIPTAASLAGFSLRHFRRIIEEDSIPIVQIGRKFFILGRDFTNWEAGKKSRKN